VPACSLTVTATPPPAAYTKAKSAVNLTQNRDATTALAQPGDKIRYQLTTRNTGGAAGSYAVVEHLEDVMEYATLTDSGGATFDSGVLTWPSEKLAGGAALVKTFTVTIKDPIPTTPVGLSDKFSYDLKLDNVYGTQITVEVAPPLAKQVEGAATQLPETGPATSTIVVLIVALLALYFYFRNRQLMTEIKMLRGSYQGGL
jgi:hypothetical protein